MKNIKTPGLTLTGAFAVLMWLIGWIDSTWLHIGFVEWMPKALQSLQVIGGIVALVIAALVSAWASYVAEAAKQHDRPIEGDSVNWTQAQDDTRSVNWTKAPAKPFWKYLL